MFAALLCGQPAAPQKPGKVEGVVTNSVTGDPVKKASVTLQPFGPTAHYVTNTDAAGHFQFDSVEPGTYQATATRGGFIPAPESMQPGFFLKPLVVAEEQKIKDLVVKLLPLAVVSGSVLDEDGDPIARATVLALAQVFTRNGKRLNPAGFAQTNDLGEYRFLDLVPGRYYIQATAPQRQVNLPPHTRSATPEEAYPVTYYPNALKPAQATACQVAPGAQLNNIDFRLHKMRAYHVRGKAVDGQTGKPVRNAVVNLQSHELRSYSGGGFVQTEQDGTFDVRGVVSGSYLVSAQAGPDGNHTQQIVNVGDQDVDDVLLALEPPLAISGTVRIDGPPLENKSAIQVYLQSDDGASGAQTNADNDGNFVLNVAPGVYRIQASGAAGAYVKAMRFGDQDVSSGRIDLTQKSAGVLTIVFGTDVAQLQGSVQTANGDPAVGVAITVAPAEEYQDRADLFYHLASDQNGKFDYRDIAPGDYKVFAWEVADQELVMFHEFRKAFESKAASVNITAGGHASVQLKLIPAAEIEAEKNKLP